MELVKRGLKSPFVIVYIILASIIAALILSPGGLELTPAVVLTFGALGILTMGFYAMSRHRGWLALAALEWLIAGLPVLILSFTYSHRYSIEMGMSALFLMGAGIVGTLAIQKIRQSAQNNPRVGWNPLGALNSGEERIDALTPSQRDHAPINKR